METANWEGVPSIMEPEKCGDVAWFDAGRLPENLMPMHKHVLAMIKKGIVYSQYGWE
jgi:hypothetical protein